VIVTVPVVERWRVRDELVLFHLDGPEPVEETLGVHGAQPAWADDGSFYYFAAPAGVTEPCLEGEGQPDRTEMRLHTLSTGEDVEVPPPLDRAWYGGGIVPDLEGLWLAVSEEASHTCQVTNLAITRVNLVTGVNDQLAWEGDGVRILRDVVMQTARDLWLVQGPPIGETTPAFGRSIWSGCSTTRRVGPACEIYCERSDHSGVDRYFLDGRAPEPVTCEGLGQDVRIMDVWQR